MARSFNGTSDYIDFGAPTSLNLGGDNGLCAVTCWVQFPAFPSAGPVIFGKGYDGKTAWDVNFQSSPSAGLGWGSFDGAAPHGLPNVFFSSMAPAWTAGSTWHLLYVDYDNTVGSPGTWKFIPDASGGTSTVDHGNYSNAAKFIIGAQDVNGSITNYAQCVIADFAIYNGPITGTELTNLFSGAIRPPAVSSRTLLGYWALTAAGSTETDLSSGGHNGTITGTTLVANPPQIAGSTVTLMGAIWL